MRLPGPQRATIFSGLRDFYNRGTTRRGKLFRLLSVPLIPLAAVAIGFVVFTTIRNNNDSSSSNFDVTKSPPYDSAQENIKSLKASDNINDLRSLANNYSAAGDYGAAADTAKQVAEKTGQIKDYMSLLTICAVREVPNKQACIDWTVGKLKAQITKLSFYNAYTAGSVLDGAGDKKNAVVFYQRALAVYDSAKVDEYTKSKDQLRKRIDELSK